MAYTFSGGTGFKRLPAFLREMPLTDMSDCGEYVYFLKQNGQELKPLIAEGDKVCMGDKIADEESYGVLPVRSSVSGTVEKIESRISPSGHMERAIVIKSDGLFTPSGSTAAPSGSLTPLEKLWVMREAGVVESDGFPSHVIIGNKKAMDYLILNGAECAPYSCSDLRRITESTDEVMDGFFTALDIVNARYGIIVLNTHMGKAKQRIKLHIRYNSRIKIITVKNKFPQNDEKILTQTVTGRTVPPMRGCSDAGVTVLSVEAAYNISRALRFGEPVLTKPVTVCGASVMRPSNLNARTGAPISALFNDCGGFNTDAPKIIYGGSLYGYVRDRLDIPVTASLSAIAAVPDIPKKVSEMYLQ